MSDRKLLIFTALQFEAQAVARELRLHFASQTHATGTLEPALHLDLFIIGPRATRLPQLAPSDYAGVVLLGLSGALDPSLRRGDILLDDASDLPPSSPSSPFPPITTPRAKVLCSPDLLSSPHDKALAFARTSAALVDMESAPVRAWAAANRLPYLGLRAVSDPADQVLDPATLRIIDPEGFLRPTWLLAEILRRPLLIKDLWPLRHSSRIARSLAAEFRFLVTSGHFPPPAPPAPPPPPTPLNTPPHPSAH